MKPILPILGLAVAVGGRVAAQAPDATRDFERLEQERWLADQTPRPPKVDTQRLVKASSSILHDREPELSPEDYAVYEKIAGMLNTNPDFALKLLDTMMGGKEKPSPAFEFVLGNAYYAAKQMGPAEKYFRSAVERYPEFLRAWKNLGVLYYTTDRLDEAVKCFSKALTLGDREASTLGLLGYCLEMQGDSVGAEMAYLQAASADPGSGDWQEGLLRIYIKGKQFGRAEPLVRSLIKAKPTEARLWFNYAGILIADHRKLEALAVLETAQAAGAAGPDELSLLGDLYAEQGLAPEAAAVYARILGPARARGEQKLIYYAEVLIAADRLAEAEQALAAVKGELTPAGRLALLQTRADLLMARKQWPEARREIQALIALAPLNGRALLALGRTYSEEKDLPHASFAFEAAYRIPEYAYRASLELANIEVQNRHFARAVAYLEKALRLQRSEAIEDYLARIRTLVPSEEKSG
jgi:tetratricopeptide (TPR) repeat protein